MKDNANSDIIVDFITGQPVANMGAEANRQQVERYLIEINGYRREEVMVDAPIDVEIDGEVYRSVVDLVVQIGSRPLIALKCAAGSLGSREREIVSAARLYGTSPLPLAVVSDGSGAIVLDAATGKKNRRRACSHPHQKRGRQSCAGGPASPGSARPSGQRTAGIPVLRFHERECTKTGQLK